MSDSAVSGTTSAYLVNGLPSLLALRVVEQILCFEPRARVYAIVHEDDIDYTQRLLSELEGTQRSRVDLLPGNLASLDFGLSGSDYLLLASRVTRLHHIPAASNVFVDASNHTEMGAALGRELIEFARAASGLEVVVAYSSAAVSGDRTGTVLEGELAEGQGFSGQRHFEQALALMELMLQRAREEIPLVVLRPSLLAADSQTGECERTSPLFRLVDAILSLPEGQAVVVPSERAPLHWVAIDYVARVAYYLGRRRDSIHKTLHLCDEHPSLLVHVLELLLRASGHQPRPSMMGAGFNQRLQPPMSLWNRASAELAGPHVFYDARQARHLLQGSGIACPAFEDYAEKVVSFVRGKRG